MPSRVTFTQINEMVQKNIAKNYRTMSTLQEQLSSGRRLMRPSDNPIDLNNDLQLRSDIRSLDQFKRNIDDGASYLAVVESVTSNTNELFQRTRELGLQSANATYTAEERGYILQEVRVILDQLVSISNNTYKGGYIFSGTNTDEQPFMLISGKEVINGIDNRAGPPPDATDTFLDITQVGVPIQIWDRTQRDSTMVTPNPNGNPAVVDILPGTLTIQGLTEGTDYDVDYVNGTITFNTLPAMPAGGIEIDYEWIRRNEKDLEGAINREIEEGLTSKINLTASEMFGDPNGTTTWDTMIKLMEGLHLNDLTRIEASLTGIDDSISRSLGAQANAGARTNRLESTDVRNSNLNIETTRLQSELEDVDFAEAISAFIMAESVHTASLQAGARVLQPSLGNFL